MSEQSAERSLRVAQVVVTDAFAGTEQYVCLASGLLARRGVSVSVIGGASAPMRAALRDATPLVRFFPAPNQWVARAMLSELGPFDVVHAHLTTAEAVSVLTFPRRSKGPLILSTRHIAARRGSRAAGRVAALAIRRRLDAQFAPSSFAADRVDGECSVLPTGIAARPCGSHDEPVVLVAQRLAGEKDTATALRAFARSRLAETGWQLHVAGEGAERAVLERLASELSIAASCRFLGLVGDMDDRIARASMVLATAIAEPFGLTVLESMAAGTAVVATAAGGHLETVGSVPEAALFSPGDAAGASELLVRYAGDPAARGRYGIALQSRQRSAFSDERFGDALLSWYWDCIGKRRAARATHGRSPRHDTGVVERWPAREL